MNGEAIKAMTTVSDAIKKRMIATTKDSIDSFEQSINDYQHAIDDYKKKQKQKQELAEKIKNIQQEDTKQVLSRIKKLRFVKDARVVNGSFEIKTKDLILKGSDPKNFNAGPYFIRFLLSDGTIRVTRERLEKYKLSKYYNHCFCQPGGGTCLGDGHDKFQIEFASGRYDTALTMLWNLLSDFSPAADAGHGYISYPNLIEHWGNAEIEIAKIEKEKRGEKAWSITGMKIPGKQKK